ncbi:MAG: cytochrome c oxidase subunit II [bacterium]|jgi:cytochrome c oxidase subunit 2
MPFVPQASDIAGTVDNVFLYILALSVIFLVFITGVMIYFAVRYNRKRHPRGEDIEGSTWLEVAWTAIPTVLFLTMFVYGWTNYSYMRSVPRDAMEITVTGRQWAWGFTYPNGKQTTELVLALDKPVKLNLRSLDVIHGFFIPAFRIKQDAVPGQENYTWFTPTRLGSFDIECTVICGVSHADMVSKAHVIPVEDFQAWYFSEETESLPAPAAAAEQAAATLQPSHPGMETMKAKGCLTCHTVDGRSGVGPTFKGLYGKRVTVRSASGERERAVDEDTLVAAIRTPSAEVLKGYPQAMPAVPLSDAEIKDVIEFIKTLR